MKRLWSITFILCSLCSVALAQKSSTGDRLYFEYNYAEAVEAYEQEARKAPLTPQQRLKLAESYFKLRQYGQSSEIYLELFKQDSVLGTADFNRMLQALSKTSNPERVKAYTRAGQSMLTGELMENATFNEAVLEQDLGSAEYEIFTLNINSTGGDFAPAFYGDDRLLFSSSRSQGEKEVYGPSGEAYMDVFVATLEAGGQARNPGPLDWLPELKYHEATPFYSPNLDAVFYVRSNTERGRMTFDENGKNSLAVALAFREGDLQLLLRDPATSFYYPYYDAERERLYFAADFEQGYGGTDIYYVATNQGRIMSSPVNLGPRINSPGNEIAPFVQDGSLYFASDVFYGFGGMDIYRAEMRGDDLFTIPVNLGPGINSRHDEFGLIVREEQGEGYLGYFSSNRPGGLGGDDLYGFRLSEAPGIKTLVFQGRVIDPIGNPLAGSRVRILDPAGNELQQVLSQEDGRYYAELPWREDVSLEISREKHAAALFDSQAILASQEEGGIGEVILAPLDAVVRDREGKKVLDIDRFLFPKGTTALTPDMLPKLDEAVAILRGFPNMVVRIEAHTDSRGSSRTNLQLSQRRAKAIEQYLLSQGVPAERIAEVEGLGESQIMNNCKEGVFCLEMLHNQNERYPLIVLNFNEL
ncbi:Outer membrane protein OmpA [Robiginitalea myxolifaciens]|uniref:Outer membrane protein OmpA n=1 Tax=Robiginitalea myxolifaciens TaxID=400055 RepID=A0A1I6FT55_9FLAO|nr:OmpA family protein [Robiginitalea myxolifaciens]SFR32987.1 Outer membrane protein OmpA [Robiginitalea myxolifaciens]